MRLSTWVITVPLGLVAVAVAVANRAPVRLSLDPFSSDSPAILFELPLYVIIFGAILIGMVFGGIAMWISQAPYRRRAWAEYRHARDLERQVNRQKKAASDAQDAQPAAEEAQSVAVTPQS